MPGRPPPATLWAAAAAGWLAGVGLQLQQAHLRPGAATAALLLALGVLAALAWVRHAVRRPAAAAAGRRLAAAGAAMVAVAAAALGFASTEGRAAWRLAERLPPTLEGQDLQVVGVVSSLPRAGSIGIRFVFEVESAQWRGAPVQLPPRLSLGWYRGFDVDALLAGPMDSVRAGQRWRFTVRLRQPHGLMNPQGFDLELWLFEQGIRAGGYVRAPLGATADSAPQLLAEDVAHPVQRLRQRLRDAIHARVDDNATAGVLAALAVGDQAAIERAEWDLYRSTGVAHLMSISGLHVTMFAWMAGAAIAAVWRRHPRLLLACPAPLAARWGGLAMALAYAVLAGWGVPAQRTVGMIALVALLRSVGLRWPLHAVLLAVAVAVTAADPWALLQPGFWLSFVAVALLVAAEPVTPSRPEARAAGSAWRDAAQHLRAGFGTSLRTQAVATAGLAPLTLVFFQQISVVGFIANLLAIPLVTLAIVPLALAGVIAAPLWDLAALLLQALQSVLQWLAGWPGAVWNAAAAPPWAMAAGLLGGAVLLLPWPWRLRLLGLPLLLPLLAPAVQRPPEGRFELLVADVGQGTAALLRTRHHLLVYDTGPPYSPEADAGERVLLPLLRARGESRIDLLVLSHRDADHIGGAASLLRALPVEAMASSLADAHPLRAGGVPHRRCGAGQRWTWDGVEFEFLHPPPELHAQAVKPNALSCVLRVRAAAGADGKPGRSLLLTGDIESTQEAALVRSHGAALRSDLLLVPHHGSRTSSTPAFIDAVAPTTALVQAAYRSRFGHPVPEVVARYTVRGIAVVRSDRCGAWTLPALGPPRCERESARRYWHHPGASPR
jgi:competence protein ComEC